ncbi:MAG: DUF1295 domain-containing protein [Chitinophagales bacterium]
MEKILGFLSPVIVCLVISVLHYVLPGRRVIGYVNRSNSNEKLKYYLNGKYVLLLVMATWFLLGYAGILPWNWLYLNRWYALAGAFCTGIIFTMVIVLPYPPVKKSLLADLFLGRLDNPQLWNGRIDAKMWLYLIGAVMLELSVLSFAAHHWLLYQSDASCGIFLSAALLTFFVIDYLTFEEVHLYTYDLFAEKVGFKLGWGCLVFYPFFYSIALWSTVDLPDQHTSPLLLLLYTLMFFSGWILSRGANLQKYHFKKNPQKTFLGIIPEAITDGNKTLLVNGFWGLSRHINYLGEILMATGIILCVGHPSLIWPWLYPIYYIALLFPRQMDDDKRCAQKYGALWNTYKEKVPYRIIPYVY